jgi:hypothetical protein
MIVALLEIIGGANEVPIIQQRATCLPLIVYDTWSYHLLVINYERVSVVLIYLKT